MTLPARPIPVRQREITGAKFFEDFLISVIWYRYRSTLKEISLPARSIPVRQIQINIKKDTGPPVLSGHTQVYLQTCRTKRKQTAHGGFMWKKNQDTPEEGGVRIPVTARIRHDPEGQGEIHVESVKDRARHQIVFTAIIFALLFTVMAGAVCRYAIVNQRILFDNRQNNREALLKKHNQMGTIYSSDDYSSGQEVLAESDSSNNRSYPKKNVFCHAVGNYIYGGGGIEDYMKYSLMTSDITFRERLNYDREGRMYPGNDVYTTLDANLQQYAYDALLKEYYRGAVIITEPATGKIRAMVSLPDFDPNTLEYTWESIKNDTSGNAALVNRVTQGAYPPGSTFKILDAVELLQENPSAMEDFEFDCATGTFGEGDVSIHCFDYEHHHEQNLKEAFAHSCNSAFAKIVSEDLDQDQFRQTLKKMMFNEELPYSLPCVSSSSQLLNEENISEKELLQVAIGQGSTLVSPLHMNMITMAIANYGVLMRPYIIDCVKTGEDALLRQYNPVSEGTLVDEKTAGMVRTLMRGVTNVFHSDSTGEDVWGTASEFNGTQNYMAYGKTGTAEFGDEDDSHAWFTGFTVTDSDRENGPADLCITVVIENGGVGSDKAVPVAKEILDRWYEE